MKPLNVLLAVVAIHASVISGYPRGNGLHSTGRLPLPFLPSLGPPTSDDGAGRILRPWSPPTDDDCRSPCPALNTLANHGFIHHTGRDIDEQSVILAIIAAFNFSPDFAISFVEGAFASAAVPLGGLLNLGELTGTPLNHPASLFHNDDIFFAGADASTNVTLVQEMLADTQPPSYPYLNISSLARTHARRVRESVAAGYPPPPAKQEAGEIGECALIMLVFAQMGPDGDVNDVVGRRFPKPWAEDWFVLNRVPDGFRRSQRPWTADDQAVLVAAIQKEGEPLDTGHMLAR